MRYGRWLVALALLAAAAIGVSACSQREASIVDQAFSSDIHSAQLSMRVKFAERQMVSISGPFRSNGDKELPSFDWQVRIADGPTGRLISTGKNVFAVYKGVTYEVGEAAVAKFKRENSGGGNDDVGSLQELQDRYGIDIKQWFSDTSTKEDAHAAGVPTTRVSGKLEVDRAVDDFAKLLARPELRKQMGASKGGLDRQALDQLKSAIQSARFSLDVGRTDHKLRRLTADLQLRGGGQAFSMGFVVELRDVDEPVSIDAPAHGRPIKELLRKIGGKELEKAA